MCEDNIHIHPHNTHTPRIGWEEEEAILKLSQWGLRPSPVNKGEASVKYTTKSPQTLINQHFQHNTLVKFIPELCLANVAIARHSHPRKNMFNWL